MWGITVGTTAKARRDWLNLMIRRSNNGSIDIYSQMVGITFINSKVICMYQVSGNDEMACVVFVLCSLVQCAKYLSDVSWFFFATELVSLQDGESGRKKKTLEYAKCSTGTK